MNQIISKYDFDEKYLKFYLFNKNNEKILYFSLSHESECCETFGMSLIPSDIQPFINKKILEITKQKKNNKDDESNTYTITIKTENGSFEIIAYNNHNGYYTHDVNIEYDKMNIIDSI